MSFLSSIKKVLNIGQSDSKKRRNFPHIKDGIDPLNFWDIVGRMDIKLQKGVPALHVTPKQWVIKMRQPEQIQCVEVKKRLETP